MTQEVARLEELLARVQRNAGLPRAAVAAQAAPVAVAVAAPAPVFVPETPLPPPPVVNQALLDSVDELLLEDPFPSAPPPPPPSYSEVLEEDSSPLISVADERADLEDVSGVVTVSELTEQQPEELLEDDIVEVSAEEVPQTALDDLNFEDEDELAAMGGGEEPPASSSRSRIAGTMDEALARAAAEQIEMDEGREVPLKTPPPESGPQAAVALPQGIHAPLAPDIEELLEADIAPPPREAGVRAAVPTTEQLGQTIELEEARGPALELDHPPAAIIEPLQEELPSEELEVTLPQREFGGGYQDDLMPPPEARQDLDAHLSRTGADEPIAPPPESLGTYPSQQPEAPTGGFAPVIVPSAVSTDSYAASVSTVTVEAPPNTEFAPELLARPDVPPSPVAKFIRAEAPRPSTFLELLDQSLSLGRD